MSNHLNAQPKTPREILYSIWGERIGLLPIEGGWGHTIENAVIINKNISDNKSLFNGFEIENIFIKYRTYVEFIHNRIGKINELSGIEFVNKVQTLIQENNGKIYDKIEVEIRGLPFSFFEELKEEWENNKNNSNFDQDLHMRRRDNNWVHETREFWFEISSFYGDPLIT